MQSNYNLTNSKTFEQIQQVAKGIVMIVCIYLLLDRLSAADLKEAKVLVSQHFLFFAVLGIILLMLLNWSLEGLKWKLLVSMIEEISWEKALKEVLIGLSLSLVFPFGIGDLGARIVARQEKMQGAVAVVFSRVIMMVLTAALGVYGLSKILRVPPLFFAFCCVFVLLLVAIVFFRKNKSGAILVFFDQLNKRNFLNVLAVSILRYAAFVAQFYLALYLFLPQIDASLLIGGIGVIYLSKTFLPSLLGGLGVRELSATFYFDFFLSSSSVVIFPVFLIWLVNTFLPSLVGLFLFSKTKSLA